MKYKSREPYIPSAKARGLTAQLGKQFIVTQPNSSLLSKTTTAYGAVYVVKDRIYTVVVQTPTIGYSETRDAAFLQSFTVTS